jgi:hypothetical protein
MVRVTLDEGDDKEVTVHHGGEDITHILQPLLTASGVPCLLALRYLAMQRRDAVPVTKDESNNVQGELDYGNAD